jgi:hypothetical protein
MYLPSPRIFFTEYRKRDNRNTVFSNSPHMALAVDDVEEQQVKMLYHL